MRASEQGMSLGGALFQHEGWGMRAFDRKPRDSLCCVEEGVRAFELVFLDKVHAPDGPRDPGDAWMSYRQQVRCSRDGPCAEPFALPEFDF